MDYERLKNAVAAYCDKYCITPRFEISDVFDIKNTEHWARPTWPSHDRAGCYAIYSASGDLLYIGESGRLEYRLDNWFTQDETGQHGVHHADHGWSKEPCLVQTIPVNEPWEHRSLELYLIQNLHPPDNTSGRVGRPPDNNN